MYFVGYEYFVFYLGWNLYCVGWWDYLGVVVGG